MLQAHANAACRKHPDQHEHKQSRAAFWKVIDSWPSAAAGLCWMPEVTLAPASHHLILCWAPACALGGYEKGHDPLHGDVHLKRRCRVHNCMFAARRF